MNKDGQKELSSQMIFDVAHALWESSNAARKTIARELLFEDYTTDISIYEFLELKLENQELDYYKSARLLRILFREFEYFFTLTENLLGFYSAGKPLEIKRTRTDVKRLLLETVALFEGLAREKNLNIELKAPDEAILKVDKNLIRRVFINLVDNAIKYSYESVNDERFIKIECRKHSRYNDWLISFESYGVGITKEEISSGSIFEYGERGELSGDRGRKGTGIGLAETKRIIDAHFGKIRVTSLHKSGDAYLTSINVILPFDGGFQRNARY